MNGGVKVRVDLEHEISKVWQSRRLRDPRTSNEQHLSSSVGQKEPLWHCRKAWAEENDSITGVRRLTLPAPSARADHGDLVSLASLAFAVPMAPCVGYSCSDAL
jgi:hypothetical protein